MNECNLVSVYPLTPPYLFLEIISCNFFTVPYIFLPLQCCSVLIQFIYLFSFSRHFSLSLYEASCFTSQQNTTTTTEMETKNFLCQVS
jgi:hypothetical protein